MPGNVADQRWQPTAAQFALELAQCGKPDDESPLEWVERVAARYIAAARCEAYERGYMIGLRDQNRS